MLCWECRKQPATIHVSAPGPGSVTERHLCGECAAREGVAVKEGEKLKLAAAVEQEKRWGRLPDFAVMLRQLKKWRRLQLIGILIWLAGSLVLLFSDPAQLKDPRWVTVLCGLLLWMCGRSGVWWHWRERKALSIRFRASDQFK